MGLLQPLNWDAVQKRYTLQELKNLPGEFTIGTRKDFHVIHTNGPDFGVFAGFRKVGYQEELPRYPHPIHCCRDDDYAMNTL